MRRYRWFKPILIMCIFCLILSGCSKVKVTDLTAQGGKDDSTEDDTEDITEDDTEVVIPELSDEYLVGIDYGGSSWGEYIECIDANVIVCTNHEVLVFMPTKVEDHSLVDWDVIATFTISDEAYENIEKKIDVEELFTLDPESDNDVCDGDSYYIRLYGADEEVVLSCGGYEPTNDYFCEMRSIILENIPKEDISKARMIQVAELEKQDAEQEEE